VATHTLGLNLKCQNKKQTITDAEAHHINISMTREKEGVLREISAVYYMNFGVEER